MRACLLATMTVMLCFAFWSPLLQLTGESPGGLLQLGRRQDTRW